MSRKRSLTSVGISVKARNRFKMRAAEKGITLIAYLDKLAGI